MTGALPDIGFCDDFAIADVNFCDDKILRAAIARLKCDFPSHAIRMIYFENNADKCRENVYHRNDGRNVEGTILRFEKVYAPANGACEIWTRHTNAGETSSRG